jgi:hypothetical protein
MPLALLIDAYLLLLLQEKKQHEGFGGLGGVFFGRRF